TGAWLGPDCPGEWSGCRRRRHDGGARGGGRGASGSIPVRPAPPGGHGGATPTGGHPTGRLMETASCTYCHGEIHLEEESLVLVDEASELVKCGGRHAHAECHQALRAAPRGVSCVTEAGGPRDPSMAGRTTRPRVP